MSRNLQLQVVLNAIDKATRPIKAITDSSSGLGKQLKQTRDQLKTLQSQQANVESFKKLKDASRQSEQAMTAQQQKVKELASRMREIDTPTKAMTKEFQAATREAHRLKDSHKANSQQMQVLRTKLNEAGISTGKAKNGTEKFGIAERELRKRIDETSKSLDNQKNRLQQVTNQQKRLSAAKAQYERTTQLASSMATTGAAGVAAGVAIGAPVFKFAKDYASFEEAMQGVAKQVDGARDDNGNLTATYHEIADAIKETTGVLPIATTEFAALIEAQARAGIQGKENLMAMATTAATASVAFEIPADEVGKSMGRIASLYKIPIESINELGDTLNWLDDSAESEGRDIISALVRMADVADKLNYKQASALASTFLTLGSEADTAAQAARAMVRELGVANMQSKRFKSGMSMLGLNSAAVQKNMSTDAMGTILQVLEKIKKLPADKQLEASTRLFGKEYGKDAGKLVNNIAELRRQLELVNDEAGKGSMQRELDIRADSLYGRKQILDNLIFNASSGLGSAMRDPLIELMNEVGSLVKQLSGWIKANPELAATLVKATAVLAVLVAGFGTLTIILASILGPLAMLKYALTVFGIKSLGVITAVKGIGSALLFVGKAMLANPIFLAIAAIAAAAYLIYTNWDMVKGFLLGLWQEVTAAFSGGIGGVSALILNWSPIGMFYKAFVAVMSYFGVELPGKFSEFGGMIMQGLINGIKNMAGGVKDAVVGMGDSVGGWFKDKLGIKSPSRVFMQFGDDTAEGLALGIAANKDSPLKQVSSMAKQVAAAGAIALSVGVTPAIATNKDIGQNLNLAAPLLAQEQQQALPVLTQSIQQMIISAKQVLPDLTQRIVGVFSDPKIATASLQQKLTAEQPTIAFDTRAPIASPAAQKSTPQAASNIEIHVHAAPGMNEAMLAQLVQREIEKAQRQQQVNKRSRMGDLD